jgi:endonuclease YncB( thermonuclease family)
MQMNRIQPLITAAAVVLLLVLVSGQGHAATTVRGRVVHIIDGDRLIVSVGARHMNVRLSGIDAPERAQDFGQSSRESLHGLCGGKPADIDVVGKDRNGRTLGQVTCAGANANAEQVRRGMAWVFDRYVKPDSPLYALQTEARQARRGLWGQTQQVPPWQWRQAKHKHLATMHR